MFRIRPQSNQWKHLKVTIILEWKWKKNISFKIQSEWHVYMFFWIKVSRSQRRNWWNNSSKKSYNVIPQFSMSRLMQPTDYQCEPRKPVVFSSEENKSNHTQDNFHNNKVIVILYRLASLSGLNKETVLNKRPYAL